MPFFAFAFHLTGLKIYSHSLFMSCHGFMEMQSQRKKNTKSEEKKTKSEQKKIYKSKNRKKQRELKKLKEKRVQNLGKCMSEWYQNYNNCYVVKVIQRWQSVIQQQSWVCISHKSPIQHIHSMNVFFFILFSLELHTHCLCWCVTEKSNSTPCGFGVCGTTTYSNDIVNEGFYANDIPTRNATMINAATNLGDCWTHGPLIANVQWS